MGVDIERARSRYMRALKRAEERWWDQEAQLEEQRAKRAYVRAIEATEKNGQLTIDLEGNID